MCESSWGFFLVPIPRRGVPVLWRFVVIWLLSANFLVVKSYENSWLKGAVGPVLKFQRRFEIRVWQDLVRILIFLLIFISVNKKIYRMRHLWIPPQWHANRLIIRLYLAEKEISWRKDDGKIKNQTNRNRQYGTESLFTDTGTTQDPPFVLHTTFKLFTPRIYKYLSVPTWCFTL